MMAMELDDLKAKNNAGMLTFTLLLLQTMYNNHYTFLIHVCMIINVPRFPSYEKGETIHTMLI